MSARVEETPRAESSHVRLLWIAVALVIGTLWLVPLFSSLWLDELGTWWAVKDGLGDTIHRAVAFHGQSPLYYLIVWVARNIGGNSEAVLRLPSLLASVASVFLLYRLARTLIGSEAARLTVLVFVASLAASFEASEARPYAIATLAVIWSTYALVRWLDDGSRWSLALTYAVLAVAVVWLHYLFALVLVPQALYAFVRLRRGQTDVSLRRLAAVAVIVTAGVVPLAIQLSTLWDRRSTLTIPSDASVGAFAVVILPPVLMAALFLGVLLGGIQDRVQVVQVRARSSTLLLLVGWLLFPVVAIFMVSSLTSVSFLSPRYFASAGPAGAMLVGWGIASLQPASVRRIVAIMIVVLSIVAYRGTDKNGEDWRGAAAFERDHADPDTVVLVHPALVESAQLDWFSDPEKLSYLLSVQSYYPMEGQVTPMPYLFDDASRAYLEGLVTGELADVDRFLLVTRYPQVPFREWLDGRLTPEGFTSRVIGTFGVIQVIEFTRSS